MQISHPSGKKNWILLHAFYPEITREVLGFLKHIPPPHQLVVTVPGTPHAAEVASSAYLAGGIVVPCQNLGFDLGGLIHALPHLDIADSDIVLKVHTKKDPGTRLEMLSRLTHNAPKIIDLFSKDPRIGILGPKSRINSLPQFMGANAVMFHKLSSRLGIDPDKRHYPFFSGTCFWIRGAILNHIKKHNFVIEEFEAPRIEHAFDLEAPFFAPSNYRIPPWLDKKRYQFLDGVIYERETGTAFDGQKAHAFERVFCCLSAQLGFACAAI